MIWVCLNLGELFGFTKQGGIAAVPDSPTADIPWMLQLPRLVLGGFSSSRKAGNYSWSLSWCSAAQRRGKGIGATTAPRVTANLCTGAQPQHRQQPVSQFGKRNGYDVPWGTGVAQCLRRSWGLLPKIK